ncbi:MAG: histidine phosphatase family protein [Anaeromyxobacter sp.]
MIGAPPEGAARLVLLRHCQAEVPPGVLCGRLDPPLSIAGGAHAARLAAALAGLRGATVHASPARRAQETAAPIARALGIEVEVQPALREVDFGSLEGLTWQQAAAAHPEVCRTWLARPEEVRFPGGEGYGEVQDRATAAVEAIARGREGATAVVVAHAGVNRAVLAWALGAPPATAFRLEQRHGAINVLERFGDGTWVLRLANGAELA